jgi:hypothetical protein
MMPPFQPVSPGDVQSRFSSDSKLLVEVLELLRTLCSRLDGITLAGMPAAKFFILFQYTKAFKTGQALRLLFSNGYDEDSQILLRVLVEQAIVIRWVHLEDSDNRATAYARYLGERQYRLMKEGLKVFPDLKLPESVTKGIEQAHEEYKRLGTDEQWFHMTRRIASLAAKAGMASSYLPHLVGSEYIHSNPTRERDYVRRSGDGVHFNGAACMPDNALALAVAAHHLLLIADVVDDVFELGASARLRELMEQVRQSGAQ